MPTVADRLVQIELKVKRAKKHLEDLEQEIKVFLGMNPYQVSFKRDPQSRKLIYYVSSVEPTPVCLPLIAGDVVQNLMSALDHLAYQVVCSDTGDAPPNPSWIYFPIQDDAAKYKAKKQKKMEGARQETFDAIDAIKPYKGGNDLLWSLYKLNNIEKHRLLITVGSMCQSFNLGAHMHMIMTTMTAADPSSPFHGRQFPVLDAYFRPADILFPLKVGAELFTDAADAEVNDKMQFVFSVAFHEPPIIEVQSILETLHQFTTLVESVVTALTPRLRDSP